MRCALRPGKSHEEHPQSLTSLRFKRDSLAQFVARMQRNVRAPDAREMIFGGESGEVPATKAAMKVLFIGGTGTISTACTKLAAERGIELTLLTRGQREASIPRGVKTVTADIHDTA